MLFDYAISTCGVFSRRPPPEIGSPTLSSRTRVTARPGERIPAGLTVVAGLVRTRPGGGFKGSGHRLNPEAPPSCAGLTGDAHVTGDIQTFFGVPAVRGDAGVTGGWRGGHRGVTLASPRKWRPCRCTLQQATALRGTASRRRAGICAAKDCHYGWRCRPRRVPPHGCRTNTSSLLHAHEHHHTRVRRLHCQGNTGTF